MASEGKSNPQIIATIGVSYSVVSTWRNHFFHSIELIIQAEECKKSNSPQKLKDIIKSVLSNKQCPGKEPVFIPQQILLIKKFACKKPKDFGCELKLEPNCRCKRSSLP